ncbi:MAG TPA: hypothetical protein VNK96_10085 [Fimbriimonadales bacterium]|nr:hypothetical protein [Fimbriimonadales bacterium]
MSIRDVFVDFFSKIHRLGLEYAVGGSYASSAWGVPRQTNDLDIVLTLDEKSVYEFISTFEKDYLLNEKELREALKSHSRYRVFQIIHKKEVVKIDVFLAGTDAYSKSEMRRKKRIELLPKLYINCLAPENIVLRKLDWIKMHPSDRQWNDVIGILETRENELNKNYMRRWAAKLKVSSLLKKAFSEVKRS